VNLQVKIAMAAVVIAMGAVVARDTPMGFVQIALGAVWLAALIRRLTVSSRPK
jgi:uncharacterized membrane protein